MSFIDPIAIDWTSIRDKATKRDFQMLAAAATKILLTARCGLNIYLCHYKKGEATIP